MLPQRPGSEARNGKVTFESYFYQASGARLRFTEEIAPILTAIIGSCVDPMILAMSRQEFLLPNDVEEWEQTKSWAQRGRLFVYA